MSIERHKQIVAEFWRAVSTDRLEHAMDYLADDSTWWVLGRLPLSGTYSKAEFKGLLAKLLAVFPQGVTVTPKVMTAEADRVAVEAESHGIDVAGKVYNNFYHFQFVFRDEKVLAVREYMDTMHVDETFFR